VFLANRWPQLRLSGRTLMVFGQYVMPWVRPIRSGLQFIRGALDTALATGDLTWVTYSHFALVSIRLFCGDPLREICKDTEHGLAFAEGSYFELLAAVFSVHRNFALGMMGRNNSFEVLDSTPPHHLVGTSLQNACFHHVAQIMLNVLAGRHEAALMFAEPGEPFFRNVRAYLEIVEYRFYTALAHAGAYDASP